MAIKRFNDYEQTKAYADIPQLPKGAYICKILGAEVCENSKGQYVKLSCDIIEGEFKNFYMNDWKNQQTEDKKWHCNYLLNVPNDDGSEQDGWTKRRFKTVITALEESNPGYHFDWDEKKLKDKIFGGLFNLREYEDSQGNIKEATNLAQVTTTEAVKAGTYKLPADKKLNKSSAPTSAAVPGFMSVNDNLEDEGLPFN